MREGRVKCRLREMIEALGYREVHLRSAEGWYRSAPHSDAYRWEADAKIADDPTAEYLVSFASFDSMTECVRYGITLDATGNTSFDVYSGKSVGKPPLSR